MDATIDTTTDTALKPDAEEDKTGIVDVKIKTKSGKVLDVEIQVNPFPYLEERISFYKSKLNDGYPAHHDECPARTGPISILRVEAL